MTSSSTPFASLSGLPVTRLHLIVPAAGIWHADVTLAQAIDLPGPQTLLLSGSTWIGTVVRAVDFAGQRQVRVVGGHGGWSKPIAALEYASQLGVPTATVLTDVAALVQELPPIVDPSVPAMLGNYFVRRAGAAALVLWDLVATSVLATWWMDPSGVVQTGPSSTLPILSPFVAEQVRGASGWYKIDTESPADWMPGRMFLGPTVSGSISRVEHRIAKGRFWTEVLSP